MKKGEAGWRAPNCKVITHEAPPSAPCGAVTELWQEWKVCEFKQTILIAAAQAFLSDLIYYQQRINAGEVRRSAAQKRERDRERKRKKDVFRPHNETVTNV